MGKRDFYTTHRQARLLRQRALKNAPRRGILALIWEHLWKRDRQPEIFEGMSDDELCALLTDLEYHGIVDG